MSKKFKKLQKLVKTAKIYKNRENTDKNNQELAKYRQKYPKNEKISEKKSKNRKGTLKKKA